MNNRRTWIIAATLAVLAGAGSWWAFADGDDAALITAPATVAD
ncbi:efflux RND transporter periplasmic adaptor subunit, partial [Mesorhizobium sp. M8A.F.Ca.ET.161.01.1.1]